MPQNHNCEIKGTKQSEEGQDKHLDRIGSEN